MTWVYTAVGIIGLIVLHELGHFAVAKALGMRVERFSLFFPPTIAKIKRGETEYAIGLIPAGGYVKITGMSPDEVSRLDLRVAERAYYMQAPWKRIAVILAGPGMNILIAFLLFGVVLISGNRAGDTALSNLNQSITTVQQNTSVEQLYKGYPAVGVLHKGDQILTIDGKPARTPLQVEQAVESHRCAGALTEGCRATSPVALTVLRDGHRLSLSIYPRYSAGHKRMLIGFLFGYEGKDFGVLGAAGTSLQELWGTTESLLTNFGKALTSSKVRHELHSIVGITEVTNAAIENGSGEGLVVLGFVSLALAVINLFPFLPLDGGHVLWSVAEQLRGRRVSLVAMWRFSSIGIVLLLFLVINGFSNDISRLGG